MHRTIISDTSILVILHKIDELDILDKVYSEIITTPEVAEEFGEKLPEWIKIHSVKDRKYQNFLEIHIDRGEASAIALAAEFEDVLLLLDDLKARKLAHKLNFSYTGVLGVMHKAKELSIVPKVKPLIEEILKTDFRIASKIIEEFLKINNE